MSVDEREDGGRTYNTVGFLSGGGNVAQAALAIGPGAFKVENVEDELVDGMSAHVGSPSEVAHGVVHYRLAEMTAGLEGEPCLGARRGDAGTRTLWDGVCVVVDVGDGHVGQTGGESMWGKGEVETVGGETLTGGLERHRGEPEGGAEEGCEGAA